MLLVARSRANLIFLHAPEGIVNGYCPGVCEPIQQGGFMEEIRSAKEQLRKDIAKKLGAMTEKQRTERIRAIETRLYDFANFLEARIALLYMAGRMRCGRKTSFAGPSI
jgi:hypothetical protein